MYEHFHRQPQGCVVKGLSHGILIHQTFPGPGFDSQHDLSHYLFAPLPFATVALAPPVKLPRDPRSSRVSPPPSHHAQPPPCPSPEIALLHHRKTPLPHSLPRLLSTPSPSPNPSANSSPNPTSRPSNPPEPTRSSAGSSQTSTTPSSTNPTPSPCTVSPVVTALLEILDHVGELVKEFPPEDTSSRFGNKAFQGFYDAVWERTDEWHKPLNVPEGGIIEAGRYFKEMWGNRTRIDYGSGHELNWVAWL